MPVQKWELTLNIRKATKTKRNGLYCLGRLLDFPDQQLKMQFLMSRLGFFLYNLWLLEAHYHHSQRVLCFCATGSSPKSIGGLLSYFFFFSTKHFLCWICRTTKLNFVNVSSFPVPSLLRRRLLLKLRNSGDVRKKYHSLPTSLPQTTGSIFRLFSKFLH